jgi:hypothetical protein
VTHDDGQATVEWVGVVLAVALILGGVLSVGLTADGRSLGGLIIERIACSAGSRCAETDRAVERAYGPSDAALVRKHLPGLVYEPGERQLPIDWRECRDVGCATAPDHEGLDAHRTDVGLRVTVFTRLQRRGDRRYIQYWFYYPDSNTGLAGSDRIWRHSPLLRLGGLVFKGTSDYPGFHRDDWEAASVRVGPDGIPAIRVTSHGHWQWCKRPSCRDRWGPARGWTRVSRGSHAGHVPVGSDDRAQIPGPELHERTTTPDGVRIVPLETLDHTAYRRLDPDIAPPWHKDSYRDPRSPKS